MMSEAGESDLTFCMEEGRKPTAHVKVNPENIVSVLLYSLSLSP
jgi:hypothetical protein